MNFNFSNIYLALAAVLLAFGTISGLNNHRHRVEFAQNSETLISPRGNENATLNADSLDENYATYFVVIADTGQDYYLLRKKMIQLNTMLNQSIDTLGRSYNTTKNLIALANDDEDAIYAGEYFPRRFPSNTLSLEYLGVYQQNAGEKTIALVSGIFETPLEADSALRMVKAIEASAFQIKATLFIGCMH